MMACLFGSVLECSCYSRHMARMNHSWTQNGKGVDTNEIRNSIGPKLSNKLPVTATVCTDVVSVCFPTRCFAKR